MKQINQLPQLWGTHVHPHAGAKKKKKKKRKKGSDVELIGGSDETSGNTAKGEVQHQPGRPILQLFAETHQL